MKTVLAGEWRPRRSRLLVMLSVCLIALVLAPGATGAQEAEEVTADATIRFVHAVIGGPDVDFLLDGQIIAEAMPYGAVTDYVPISPSNRVLQVVPTGQPGDAAIVEQELDVEQAGAYIFVALGPLNVVEGRVYDVNLEALTPGTARGRLIDATHDTGALDISVTGGDTLFSDVEYGEASDYAELAPGVYGLDLRGDDNRVLGTIPDIAINPSRAYDFLTIGQLADESVTLLTLVTTVDPTCAEALGIVGTIDDSCVRLTHTAPDSAGIDAYVNDSLIAENLEYGTATEFITIPAGEGRVFDITATGAATEEAIIEADFALDAGQAYEVLVTGAPDDLQLTITGVDLRPVPEGQARLGVIHTYPDTGSLDISFADGPTIFEGIEFRGISEYIAVDEGRYALQLHPAEDQMIISESEFQVQSGTVYDVVIVGRSDNQSVEVFVLTAPVPLRQGVVETPATNITATPAASGPVEPVATLDTSQEAADVAETTVAAEATPVP